MPNMDGTGPRNQRRISGRGMGPCGRGLRRGAGYGQSVFLDNDAQKKALQNKLSDIESEKKEIENKLAGM